MAAAGNPTPSLPTGLSSQKSFITIGLGQDSVSEQDEKGIQVYIKWVQKRKPTVADYTQELRRRDLQKVCDHHRAKIEGGDPFMTTMWAALTAGNATGMRAGEMFNGHLLWS